MKEEFRFSRYGRGNIYDRETKKVSNYTIVKEAVTYTGARIWDRESQTDVTEKFLKALPEKSGKEFRFKNYSNNKIYDTKIHDYVAAENIIPAILNEGAEIICNSSGQNLTVNYLSRWMSWKMFDEFQKLSLDELRAIAKEMPPGPSTQSAALSERGRRGAASLKDTWKKKTESRAADEKRLQKSAKDYARTKALREERGYMGESTGWSQKTLRRFYNLQVKREERECLGCSKPFPSSGPQHRRCDGCARRMEDLQRVEEVVAPIEADLTT